MAANDFAAETPQNFEQKTIACIVVDVSGSMQGAPIGELNKGLKAFEQDIRSDSATKNRLEVVIVTFADRIDRLIDPTLAADFKAPALSASGTTKMVDGVREGLNVVRQRKDWYKSTGQPFLRPWVILITDGAPDDDQDVAGLGREVRAGVSNKDFMFFAIGVQGADMRVLTDISDPGMPPAKLDGLKFFDFFKWMSRSMAMVASSRDGQKVNLPNPAGWMQGVPV